MESVACKSKAEGSVRKFNAESRRRRGAEIRTIGETLVMRVRIATKSNLVKPGRSLTYPDTARSGWVGSYLPERTGVDFLLVDRARGMHERCRRDR